MRLNRFLAAAGLGSRRACEALIQGGRVLVNGQRCEKLATDILPSDTVLVDGRRLRVEPSVYILLNKPVGYLTTQSDERGRATVFDLLAPGLPRLFHVGRLDRDSEGLLLLTNDGELAQRLTHPRYKIDKEYEVLLDRPYDAALTARLLKGVFIPVEEGPGSPEAARGPFRRERARAESIRATGPRTVSIVLRQGLKRQIRHMFFEVGYEVEKLRRVRLGPLTLGRLKPGQSRELTVMEVAALRAKPGSSLAKVRVAT